MARRLYIVSAYRPHLMGEMVLNLGLSEDTRVFIDRRHGERRSVTRPAKLDGTGADRRRSSIDGALRRHGVAIVEVSPVAAHA